MKREIVDILEAVSNLREITGNAPEAEDSLNVIRQAALSLLPATIRYSRHSGDRPMLDHNYTQTIPLPEV